MTMNVAKPEKSTQSALATTTDVEGIIRDLVRVEASSPPSPPGETGMQPRSDQIAPLIAKIVAPSVAEFEKLIGELQEAKAYLQSEGERIRRETDSYLQLSQSASESVKVISDAIGEWRKAGHPAQ
jgi:hypothetical protein